MSIRNIGKLNQLQQVLPEGLPVNSAWLQAHGYSRPLISKYVKSGWLQSPILGVYRRSGALLTQNPLENWESVVVSLQQLFNLPIIPGGRTALELQGYAHYLALAGPKEVYLYGSVPLPNWVNRLPMKSAFVFRSTNLFQTDSSSQFHEFSSIWDTSANTWCNDQIQIHYTNKPWGAWNCPLIISTAERAVLELLAEVPHYETFEQADALIQGLSNLSPKRLNNLLANCHSVKVKRLFLWFAERHHHPWFNQLDKNRINLGSGKRAIIQGGRLDKKYLITVPKNLSNND